MNGLHTVSLNCNLAPLTLCILQKTSSLQSLLENRKVDTEGRQVEADLDQSIKRKEEDTAERHTVAARQNDGPLLKGSRKSLNEQMHKHFG